MEGKSSLLSLSNALYTSEDTSRHWNITSSQSLLQERGTCVKVGADLYLFIRTSDGWLIQSKTPESFLCES